MITRADFFMTGNNLAAKKTNRLLPKYFILLAKKIFIW